MKGNLTKKKQKIRNRKKSDKNRPNPAKSWDQKSLFQLWKTIFNEN